MAYIRSFNKNDNLRNTSSTDTIQGGSSPSSQSGSNQISSGWTNLQNYVSANEGNDAQMADKITLDIEGNAEKVREAGSNFDTSARETIDQNTVQNSLNLTGDKRLKNGVDMEKLAAQYNATYSGPDSADKVDGYQDTYAGYNAIQNRADNSGSFEGRTTLLEDSYKRDDYNAGMKGLDSFLLGAGDAGRNAMQNISDTYGGYLEAFNTLSGGITDHASKAKETTDKTREATRGAVGTTWGGIRSDVDGRVAAQNAANDQIEQDLGSGDLNKINKALSDLGFSVGSLGGKVNNLYGLDPTKYFTKAQTANASNAVSSDEAAMMRALAQITGQSAGAYGTSKGAVSNSFDGGKFTDDLIHNQDVMKRAENLTKTRNEIVARGAAEPTNYQEMLDKILSEMRK